MAETEKKGLRSLLSVIGLYRQRLGRRFYWLVVLMPLSALSEGFGITLLLPFMASLDQGIGAAATGANGGMMTRIMDWLPLPESPVMLLLLVAAAFLGKAALKFGTEVLRALMQAKLITQLKADFVEEYTRLDYPSFTGNNTGHYVNIVTSQTSLVGQSFRMLSQTLIMIVAAGVYLTIAALVNWRFAAVALVAGCLFILVMRVLVKRVAHFSRMTVEGQTELNALLVQVLHALKYLMSTATSERLVARVRKTTDRLYGYYARMGVAQAFATSINEPLSVILLIALIGLQLFVFGQPLANIIVALLLLDRATKALFSVQSSWQKTMELVGATEAVMRELQFVEEKREKRGSEILPRFSQEVVFENLEFAYVPKDGPVLKNVDLRIERNQTVAIVGHSGAGKSTVADLLTLLLRPTDGAVKIDGRDAREIDPQSWRAQLGYVCQETVVFDQTIAANICLDAEAYERDEACRERVRVAAEQAFAAEFIGDLPDGFDTVVGDRGVRLSGGQRQRLFIARELYKRPALLLLDEATSALDGESEKAIQASIEALHGQMTVVVIAHRLATIKNADRIYVMDQGQIVEEGSFGELNAREHSRLGQMVKLQSL